MRTTQEGRSADYQYEGDLLTERVINHLVNGQPLNTPCFGEFFHDTFLSDVSSAFFRNGDVLEEEHSYGRPSQSYKINHFDDSVSRYRLGYSINTKTASFGIRDGDYYSDVLSIVTESHSVTREYDCVHVQGGGSQTVSEEYDTYGRLESITYGGVPMASFSYDENYASLYCSLLTEVVDLFSGRGVSIEYGIDKSGESRFRTMR